MAIIFPPTPSVGDRFTPTGQNVTYECVSTSPLQWSVYSSGIVSGQQAGTICWHASTVAPFGWLIANGSAVSRTTYARLFATIGVAFGPGDGSTTFNLPPLLGRFIRGHNSTPSGIDANRVFGSSQDDAMQQITGTVTSHSNRSFFTSAAGAFAASETTVRVEAESGGPQTPRILQFDSANSPGARTSTETRPTNIALTPIIKAYDDIENPALLNAADIVAKVNELDARLQTIENL